MWGIGVDADQSYLGPQVLTSAMKRVDTSVYATIQQVLDGKFAGGTDSVFSIENDGVGAREGQLQGAEEDRRAGSQDRGSDRERHDHEHPNRSAVQLRPDGIGGPEISRSAVRARLVVLVRLVGIEADRAHRSQSPVQRARPPRAAPPPSPWSGARCTPSAPRCRCRGDATPRARACARRAHPPSTAAGTRRSRARSCTPGCARPSESASSAWQIGRFRSV